MTIAISEVPRNTLPGTDITLPALSLGSWHTFDRIRFHESVALISTALGLGINHFDVGVYDSVTPGFTDIIFASVMRGARAKRDQYQLSFKLWLSDSGSRTLREQLETALLRGHVDYADLAMLGEIPDEWLERIPDLVGELAGFIDDGLIRGWGINNWPAVRVEEARAVARSANVPEPVYAQLKYSVARRAIADGDPYTALYRDGLSLEPSDVFEGGILAGRADIERQIGKDPGQVRERIIGTIPALTSIALSFGVSPAEFSLAFALSHPAAATTLFGATRLQQLESAMRALAFLQDAGAETIRAAAEPLWVDRDAVDPAS